MVTTIGVALSAAWGYFCGRYYAERGKPLGMAVMAGGAGGFLIMAICLLVKS